MPIRKTPTSSSYQASILAPLTSRTIFSAASNTTGIQIMNGTAFELQSSSGYGHYVISTSAPSAMTDGLCVSKINSYSIGALNGAAYRIDPDIYVPSGYGLYWISTATVSVGSFNDVSWSAA